MTNNERAVKMQEQEEAEGKLFTVLQENVTTKAHRLWRS